jgi:betaine lipid synthase
LIPVTLSEIVADNSHAFAYWKKHADQFSSNFYLRGYSGHGIRLSKVAFALAGVRGAVKQMCAADSTKEQERIWQTKLRPVLLNKALVTGFLGNPYVYHLIV